MYNRDMRSERVLVFWVFSLTLLFFHALPIQQAQALCFFNCDDGDDRGDNAGGGIQIPGLPFFVNNPDRSPATQTPGQGTNNGTPSGDLNVTGGVSSCDSTFMNQIISRASYEVEREMTVNRETIKKPDSVLEYSCFEDAIERADAAGVLSNTDIFSDKEIEGSAKGNLFERIINGIIGLLTSILNSIISIFTSELDVDTGDPLDEHLDSAVEEPLNSYLEANFSGGPCRSMRAVWGQSQCGTADLNRLSAVTARNLPASCQGSELAGNDLEGGNLLLGGYQEIDQLHEKIAPPGSNYTPTCGAVQPIPTGLTLNSGKPEKTCLNPSCYYDAERDACFN